MDIGCIAAVSNSAASQRKTARKSHHDAAAKSSQGWQLIPLDSTIGTRNMDEITVRRRRD
jgi:hypothetical protein